MKSLFNSLLAKWITYAKVVFALLFIIIFRNTISAQNELEFYSGSQSPTSGPITTPFSATFFTNTTGSTFVPYAPAVVATFSILNQ